MKIKSIAAKDCTPEQVALETEPELTKEVFEIFIEGWLAKCFSLKEGKLIVKLGGDCGPPPDAKEIQKIEASLHNAEVRAEQAKTQKERSEKERLQSWSTHMNLPLS